MLLAAHYRVMEYVGWWDVRYRVMEYVGCALSSYGVRGMVGCALSSYGALKKLELPSALASATLTLLSCSPNFPRAP